MSDPLKLDLTPTRLDLKIYSGDGYRFRLVIKDKDENPVPITGEVIAQVRKTRGSNDDPQASFEVDDTDFSTGIIALHLTGESCHTLADTAKFNGFWDVQWTPSGGDPKTLAQGKLECDLDVSR